MRSVGHIASMLTLAALLSLGGIGQALAVDMEGDSDTPTEIPPSIPPQHATYVFVWWHDDCWSNCTRIVIDWGSGNNGGGFLGTGIDVQQGVCYQSRTCPDHFNQGNPNFYPGMGDVPDWPSNPHQIFN